MRSSAALACSEESGRSAIARAKRAGGIGVLEADMVTGLWKLAEVKFGELVVRPRGLRNRG